jgi:hypothetical protein
MNEEDITNMMEKLTARMKEELELKYPYEAMMYVQTFVARKRKTLSHQNTCKLVFCGINVLLKHSEWESAGALLDWLLSTGALELNPSNTNFDTVSSIISSIQRDHAMLFLDKAYTPLCSYIQTLQTELKHRYMFQLSMLCGEIFEHCHRWRDAKTCYIGVGDMTSLVRVTHMWSLDGFPSEYSLFFARGYLIILAGKLVPQAAAFYKSANDEYMEPYELTISCGPATALQRESTKCYALWQLCTIIYDLMGMADNPLLSLKVDRKKVFMLLLNKYQELLIHYDAELYRTMQQIGKLHFGIVDDTPEQVNPMQALLGSMMGGGGGGVAARGAIKRK